MPALDRGNQKDYRVRLEIQLELLEDICKEKSQFHKVRHPYYNQTRRFRLLEKLVPHEIEEYRDRFWTDAREPIDEFWGRERLVLTTKLEREGFEADLARRSQELAAQYDF